MEGQEGKSLNDKFETLVLFCYYEKPKRKEELAQLEKQIQERRQKLYDLQRATDELYRMEQSIQTAKRHFETIANQAKALAEKDL